MTDHTPNLQQIVAEHQPDEPGCTGCSWHVHPLACDYDDFTAVHAAHVVAVIRDSGLTVIALPEDEWCREESCRHRHWRGGSMPTHKRGSDCPPPALIAASLTAQGDNP